MKKKYHYESKRYSQMIDFIAQNDEPNDVSIESIQGYTTVQMLRHCYNLKSENVASDVLTRRLEIGGMEKNSNENY